MGKPRNRAGTGAGGRVSPRIVNVRDRREREALVVLGRRPLSRKISEAQRSAVIIWDEV